MIPDVQEAGEKVIWTSGLIFGNGEVCCIQTLVYGTLLCFEQLLLLSTYLLFFYCSNIV